MNKTAFEAMGSPLAVTLLYNRQRRLIALRPTDPTSPRAYPLRAQSSGATHLVAATAFTQHHQIDTTTARRYGVQIVDHVLVIDLNQDAPEVTGPRARELRRDGNSGDIT